MTQYRAWFIMEKTYHDYIEADSWEEAEDIANDNWDTGKGENEYKHYETDYRVQVDDDELCINKDDHPEVKITTVTSRQHVGEYLPR
jgi:hypothetical protein